MGLKLVSSGITGAGTDPNMINIEAINQALVEKPSDYVAQANTYGSWLNTTFSLDSDNKLKVTNAPTDFSRETLLNVVQLVANNLGTTTTLVSILFTQESSTVRGTLDNYGFTIKYDLANTINKIYPHYVDVVEATPIAIN